MDARAAHTTMSKQAIDSERVRDGLKDILLGPAQLYEALRDKAGDQCLERGYPTKVELTSGVTFRATALCR
jgi:hypothetical protein